MENIALEFQIGEISHFFDIPASTLRYWEEMQVLSPNKGETSHYREYAVEDLMTISDVIFYKNLGFQLKQIREMKIRIFIPAYSIRTRCSRNNVV